jgi:integrase
MRVEASTIARRSAGLTGIESGISRLTVAGVKAAGPGKYPDGANLWLQVGPSGSKSWYLRFALNGRTREMGLGPYPLVSLAEARDKATVQRRLLLDGIDPIEARKATRRPQREAITFATAAKQYLDGHEKAWRSADHARQWRNSLDRYVFPAIGSRPVAEIDTHDVLSIVEPLWQDKTETATRLLDRIGLILDWATARKLRSGDNPARWRGHLEAVLPARSKVQPVEHHAARAIDAVPEFMEALRAQDGAGERAAELMTLTGCRTGEVRFADWSEIDLEAAVWTIPAARMKAQRDHRIPLSKQALALLTSLPGDRAGRAFPGLGQHAILKAIQRINREVVAHGFRSTFRNWADERTNFPRELAEMSLAHVVGGKVERAYWRDDMLDKRRPLMEAWARYCAGGAEAKVIPLAPKGRGRERIGLTRHLAKLVWRAGWRRAFSAVLTRFAPAAPTL